MDLIYNCEFGRQVFQLNVFSNRIFSGNPATVVWQNCDLSDSVKQQMAREFNNPETMFIKPNNDSTLGLRYFTPTTEVDSCAHGTLAAAYVAYKLLKQQSIAFDCSKRQQEIEVKRHLDKSFSFCQSIISPASTVHLSQDLLAALGSPKTVEFGNSHLSGQQQTNNRLLLEVVDNQTLFSLSPDFKALAAELAKIGCFGVFVYSLQQLSKSRVFGRMFAPGIGIDEDPVNGNSAIALASLLYDSSNDAQNIPQRLTFYQGDSVNRPGKVDIERLNQIGLANKIEIRGDVTELYRFNFQPKL